MIFSEYSAAVAITEESQIGEARRTAVQLSERSGFDEERRGKVAIVTTELARNILRHATKGGEIVIQRIGADSGRVDILALDGGPGMGNVAACLRDGYSTGGTAGQGLGAIRRLADDFDVYSHPLSGTAVFAGFYGNEENRSSLQFGVISLPVAGETVCGDSWSVAWGSPITRVIIADGLGHGPLAAEASLAAIRIFDQSSTLSAPRVMEIIHLALRATRGAAVSIATVDREKGSVDFLGVGNVAGAVASPPDSVRIMVGHNGTVGAQMHKLQTFSYSFVEEDVLLLASDGLSPHWRLDKYPTLLQRHPALIAGVLYRDTSRARDDVTILVMKSSGPTGEEN